MESIAALNWLSVIIASLVAMFVVGGIWYGPLFGKSWMREWGFSEQDLAKRKLTQVFGISFLLILIAAVNLAMFIGPQADFLNGAVAGFLAGIGWIATLLGVLYLFEQRSLKLYLINAGYCVVSLTVMGMILGMWPK